jgi:hypothetical protein
MWDCNKAQGMVSTSRLSLRLQEEAIATFKVDLDYVSFAAGCATA